MVILVIALIAGLSLVITREGCQWAVARGRRPSGGWAVVGAVVSPLLVVVLLNLLVNGWEMFTFRFWEDDLTQIMFVDWMRAGTITGLVPAWLVMHYYRQKRSGVSQHSEPEAR